MSDGERLNHTCIITECNKPVFKDRNNRNNDLCHAHYYQCAYQNCQKLRVWDNKNYGSFCKDHSCNDFDCANRGRVKCKLHLCIIPGCFTMKYNDGKIYCYIHGCRVPKCTNLNTGNREGCRIHSCKEPECLAVADNGHYCWVHKCGKFFNCPNRRTSNEEIYCNSCLRYCEIEDCSNLHAPGDRRCKEVHACRCYGGPRQRQYCCGRYYNRRTDIFKETIPRQPRKRKFQCGSYLCRECRVSESFLMIYFMTALGCDTPILEGLHLSYN